MQGPGLPTPGQPSAIRPPIASYDGAGILTCFPSATHLCLALGADSPYADERCVGNLGLTARGPFTPFIATHVSIRTSDTSSILYKTPSQAYRTLSYHACAPLNPLAFTPNDQGWGALSMLRIDKLGALKGTHASAASVTGLAPLHLPRRTTRSVSYYAFFKGWLLLSQPPDCFSLPTSFPT